MWLAKKSERKKKKNKRNDKPFKYCGYSLDKKHLKINNLQVII